MTPEERYERFEEWLGFMPDALASWMERVPEDLSKQLDYSITSLEVLEEWLLQEFPDARSAVGGENFLIGDGAARYIGETLIRNFGGRWDMDVHDPNSLVFGTPCIRGFGKGGIPVVPLRLVVNALDRREGGHFKFVAGNLA